MIYIGTAGWGIPRQSVGTLPREGSNLQRYAHALNCVEINSSFYRPHRRSTYAGWAAQTPPSFRFAVKMPKALTHDARLDCADADLDVLDRFLDEVSGLGSKLGALLLQIPRSLEFDPHVTTRFLTAVRKRWDAPVLCEPRHASWFARPADRLIDAHAVGRVAADPAVTPSAAHPREVDSIVYYRWHGSPRTYWSPYPTATLERLAAELIRYPETTDVWCIFDNTATGSALPNAIELASLVRVSRQRNGKRDAEGSSPQGLIAAHSSQLIRPTTR